MIVAGFVLLVAGPLVSIVLISSGRLAPGFLIGFVIQGTCIVGLAFVITGTVNAVIHLLRLTGWFSGGNREMSDNNR
jgi:hypothetical protein